MSTPAQLGRKFGQLSNDLTYKVPAAGLLASAQVVHAATVAGANRASPPGGSQVKMKSRARGTNPSAVVYGYGFAVLAEYGSWRKPDGWDIFPKGLTNSMKVGVKSGRSRHGSSLRGIEAKAMRQARRLGYRKIMLGDESTGMAATFAHHPPKKAEPFVAAVTAATAPACGKAHDRAVAGALARTFGF